MVKNYYQYKTDRIINKFSSFNNLTDDDLYEIAEWGLENEFSFSGVWDIVDNMADAIKETVLSFKNFLNKDFPEGFKNMPNIVICYRMVVLNKPEDLNRKNLGKSWFTNPDRIKNPDFTQQLMHLNTKDVYLITANIPQSKMDIPRSLFQRDMIYWENEIVLKDDTNIEVVNLEKIR